MSSHDGLRSIAVGAIAALVLIVSTVTAPAQQPRELFRGNIERAFLRNGISVEVVARGGELMIYGWMTKALVYQLITDGKILDNGKSAGFTKIDFVDRGDDGRWTFDLSGDAIPRCDVRNRVCR